MPEHVSQWLGAYLDEQLKGARLRQVEAHLAECPACQDELQALRKLSVLLQQAPKPVKIPDPERFANQVMIHLPPVPQRSQVQRSLDAAWWLPPVGILLAWIFTQTVFLLSDWILAAYNLDLLGEAAAWLAPAGPGVAWWSNILDWLGLLNGESLQWLALGETLSRNLLSQLAWQIPIAALYMGWLALWLMKAQPLQSAEKA
jgi:anti-sigma factor RsiW